MFLQRKRRRKQSHNFQTTPTVTRSDEPARPSTWTNAMRSQAKLPIQTKLTVNQPGDMYEQEADQVANRVMRMPEQSVQRRCACGGVAGPDGECAACKAKRLGVQRDDIEEEEDQVIQTKRASGSVPSREAPASVHQTLSASGQPLSASARSFMEPRFGQDFSHVRVHTDSQAAQSAADVNARAYTVGNNIVFGAGQYPPPSSNGQQLIAHELVHVQQQADNPSQPRIQRQLFPPVPIVVMPPSSEPVVINAVDARQESSMPWYSPPRYTGPLTNFFRGDVTMTNIATMVRNVIAHLNGRRMQRLNIMDHGNSHGIEIGDDWLASPADVARFSGTLGRLSAHFASNAIVHLQNCEAGQNRDLICSLAATFGVTVYAGTGAHNPIYGFNLGDYVSCSPGGVFNPNTGRPSTPSAPRASGQPDMA